MLLRHLSVCVLLAGAVPCGSLAQSTGHSASTVNIELNTVNEIGAACRLTFVAENSTGSDIEEAVLETVVFDTSGGVVTLSLFDFRDLPQGRPRVRQFDIPGIVCSSVGRVLINGAHRCIAEGEESSLCEEALSLSSRIAVELLG